MSLCGSSLLSITIKSNLIIFLIFTDAHGGEYKCIAENKAGRVETNYTLNVGYFTGPGSLNTGEIVGVSITIILMIMIIIVIIAVLILKVTIFKKKRKFDQILQ